METDPMKPSNLEEQVFTLWKQICFGKRYAFWVGNSSCHSQLSVTVLLLGLCVACENDHSILSARLHFSYCLTFTLRPQFITQSIKSTVFFSCFPYPCSVCFKAGDLFNNQSLGGLKSSCLIFPVCELKSVLKVVEQAICVPGMILQLILCRLCMRL